MNVATQDGVDVFVKVDKRQEWLLKASVGKNARPPALSTTTLFDDLKAKPIAAVADSVSDSQGHAPDDPMSALVEIAATPNNRNVYAPNRGKDNITEVTMPAFEPTAHPGDEMQRVVRLLASSTSTMWVSGGNVEWLVTWLSDEHRTGGVPLDDPAAAGKETDGGLRGARRSHLGGTSKAPGRPPSLGELKGNTVNSFAEKLTVEEWAAADEVHHDGT